MIPTGTTLSEEHKQKISIALKGRKKGPFSEEHKRKLSESHRGIRQSEETRKKKSLSCMGKNKGKKPSLGMSHSIEARRKMSEYHTGLKHSEETRRKLSVIHTGKKLSEEHKRNISKSIRGDKHYNWQGGIAKEPYSQDWTEDLRDAIRKRDGHMCQLCCTIQNDLNGKLHVHHCDYDKKNCDPVNLISLCHSCHSKTHYNRKAWMDFFRGRNQQYVDKVRKIFNELKA